MKQLILFLFLLFAGNICLAQECPEGYVTILEDDDSSALADIITPENMNLCCMGGYTILSEAIRQDAPLCIEWLIKKGADVNMRCGTNKPPIYLACKYGDLALFKMLLAKGADIKADYGNGLLAYAIKYNKPDIADYLKAQKK